MTSATDTVTAPATRASSPLRVFVRRNPTIVIGSTLLTIMVLAALFAPWIVGDPLAMAPINRLKPPSAVHWFGTDHLGRDVLARTIFGARVSLTVGVSVAILSVSIGLGIGLAAGYFRRVDAIVMRFMDGLMAIPGILLAIALVALTRASIWVVIVAITIPEIPRVVRLVRSVVLTVREQPYVDAAIAGGSRSAKIILRHILPATLNPLIVQATYISASAILVEAGLSFLGAGVPPEIPTWGNMIAAARGRLAVAPWTIFFPGLCLALVVLAVNLLGDGLRDRLDPRIARRM
ncbi:MAG: ABC transporter permease [Alphaproteobacteria bacterium]|nr:ABC transporter permease [Alphaproteobacteria bacterium]